MQRLYDLSSIRRTLRDGIAKGYWTLEDLDNPPPGFIGTNHRNVLRDSGDAPQQPPPGEELDGVTVHTNDHPIPELPF
jgi:hypothetical protein